MEEFETIRCRTCGGVAHPSSGCVYHSPRSSDVFIVCGPCVREAWKWIVQMTASKGRRGGQPGFYSSVNVIGEPIFIESTATTGESR